MFKHSDVHKTMFIVEITILQYLQQETKLFADAVNILNNLNWRTLI